MSEWKMSENGWKCESVSRNTHAYILNERESLHSNIQKNRNKIQQDMIFAKPIAIFGIIS